MNFKKFYSKQGKYKYKLHKIDIDRYETISKEIKPNSFVLDIGCRDGELSSFLPKGCRYVAVDISASRVKRLKSMKFDVHCFDICNKLPKQLENKFDYVVIGELLEHLPNPFNALLNIRKSLKTNGILLGTTPNPYSLDRMIRIFFGINRTSDHVLLFDSEELSNMLKFAGFYPLIIKRKSFMWVFDCFFGWYIFFKARKSS